MKKGKWLMVSLILIAVGLSSCLSRIEKSIINKREYEPFQEKVYPEPTRYIQVNDITIAYIEKGEGPTLILIHGGVIPMGAEMIAIAPYFPPRAKSLMHMGAVSTIDTWQYNIDALARNFHVIALDLPGFGNSEKPDSKYRIPDFTTYLHGFMEAKEIDKASLIGHDLGGLIAIDFSLTYPEKVQGMVLISPYGTVKYGYGLGLINISHYPRWIARTYQKENAAWVNILLPINRVYAERSYRQLLHHEPYKIVGAAPQTKPMELLHHNEGNAKEFMDQVVEYKFQYIKTKEFSDELLATHYALIDTGRYDWWNIMKLGASERTDWVTRVKDIQAPTLVIWGVYDPSFAKAMGESKEAEYLDAAIPNSLVSIYESSSHYPMVEQAEKFNKDVTLFLKGAAGP